MWPPKHRGHLVCKKVILSQNLQISCQNYHKICKFLKMRYEARKNAIVCKIWYESGIKGVIGCGLKKKGGHSV